MSTSKAAASPELLRAMDAYWRAANYLTVGQIYLQENALLRKPLRPEHIKPRLLGHWGTSPGLSFVYVHVNRLIRDADANVIFLTGPGHGGPAILANVYLEGSYSEIYPEVSQDLAGLRRLYRQFSTGPLIGWCEAMLAKHEAFVRQRFEDMPEIRDWTWVDS